MIEHGYLMFSLLCSPMSCEAISGPVWVPEKSRDIVVIESEEYVFNVYRQGSDVAVKEVIYSMQDTSKFFPIDIYDSIKSDDKAHVFVYVESWIGLNKVEMVSYAGEEILWSMQESPDFSGVAGVEVEYVNGLYRVVVSVEDYSIDASEGSPGVSLFYTDDYHGAREWRWISNFFPDLFIADGSYYFDLDVYAQDILSPSISGSSFLIVYFDGLHGSHIESGSVFWEPVRVDGVRISPLSSKGNYVRRGDSIHLHSRTMGRDRSLVQDAVTWSLADDGALLGGGRSISLNTEDMPLGSHRIIADIQVQGVMYGSDYIDIFIYESRHSFSLVFEDVELGCGVLHIDVESADIPMHNAQISWDSGEKTLFRPEDFPIALPLSPGQGRGVLLGQDVLGEVGAVRIDPMEWGCIN